MEYEAYKKYLNEEVFPKYKEEQKNKSKLLSTNILPHRPDLGFFIEVNGIEIAEKVFKEEFNVIKKAFYSVIYKLNM